MMIRVRTCCFCYTLRAGTIATAVFILVTRILALISFAAIFGVLSVECQEQRKSNSTNDSEVESMEDGQHCETQILYATFIPLIFACIISGSFGVLLLMAVIKSKIWMFWAWFTMASLEIVAGIIGSVVFVAILPILSGITAFLIGTALVVFHGYLLLCVFCYYKQLSSTIQGLETTIPYALTEEECSLDEQNR